MKKSNLILTASAVMLVLSAGINSANAYFTTYAEAKGGYEINLGDRTKINEKFTGWIKYVTITSDEKSEPVYVRAKAFSGSQYTLQYSGSGWTLGNDGYYYYNSILNANESTSELLVQINGVPVVANNEDSFNVIVVYESTPVIYDAEGNPKADWSAEVKTGSVESAMQQTVTGSEGVVEIQSADTDNGADKGGVANE